MLLDIITRNTHIKFKKKNMKEKCVTRLKSFPYKNVHIQQYY